MSSKRNHHSKQFKLDAINYRNEHPDLTQVECAKNLGIAVSTLAKWERQFRNNDGDIPVRGSGNYQSDGAKEIARLKRSNSFIKYNLKYGDTQEANSKAISLCA